MIFSKFWLTIIFGMVWIPQISLNIMKNQKDVPKFSFALIQTANFMLLPIYMNLVENNFFFMRPNYTFGFFLLSIISL